MKTLPDESATGHDEVYQNRDGSIQYNHHPGLTKRELFAAMAMQGLCSANDNEGQWTTDPIITSIKAVEYADALITALNEPR